MPNDALTDFLLHDRVTHASLSAEMLELMGKKVANMFLDEGLSLNEGVAKLASQHDDINQEQVKRICEFANTAVYLAKHDQNKTAGANSSYPQFQLADASRVIQDMSDGARPTVVTQTDVDYGRQPLKKEKVSSVESDAILEEAFNIKEAQIRDGLTYSKDTALEEVMSAKEMLTSLKQQLEHVGEDFDLSQKEASANYYESVKRHLLDGGDFADVMAAARSSKASNEKISAVMQPVIEQLLREKVASADALKASLKTLTKLAHRVVNESHPLVLGFREIYSLNDEIATVSEGLAAVDKQLSEVSSFVEEKFSAATAS